MELWLRYKNATHLKFDEQFFITSQKQWKELIYNPELISSILWPSPELFSIKSKHNKRKHKHEIDYKNNIEVNLSYLQGCKDIAYQLNKQLSGSRCLIYAPLRGALPIWRGISQFISDISIDVYYPVTSSFISFPEEFGILGRRNRTASGRYNNRFELARIQPFLEIYDYFIYVDEIISGAMMLGHLKDMFNLKINEKIPIIAVGLADLFGNRSVDARRKLNEYIIKGKLESLVWSGCETLITEDQKFILGAHYVDNLLGPHIVPVLDDNFQFYDEKRKFDNSIFCFFTDRGMSPDHFLSSNNSN